MAVRFYRRNYFDSPANFLLTSEKHRQTDIAAGKLSILESEFVIISSSRRDGKLSQHRLTESRIKKLWNQDVAKGFGNLKLLAIRGSFVE